MNICIRVYMHKNWYSYIISYHSTRILLLLQWPTIPIIIRNVSHKCKCTHATQTKSRFLSKYYHLNFQHLKSILIIICAPHRQSSTHMHTCGWYVAMSPRHAIVFFVRFLLLLCLLAHFICNTLDMFSLKVHAHRGIAKVLVVPARTMALAEMALMTREWYICLRCLRTCMATCLHG